MSDLMVMVMTSLSPQLTAQHSLIAIENVSFPSFCGLVFLSLTSLQCYYERLVRCVGIISGGRTVKYRVNSQLV